MLTPKKGDRRNNSRTLVPSSSYALNLSLICGNNRKAENTYSENLNVQYRNSYRLNIVGCRWFVGGRGPRVALERPNDLGKIFHSRVGGSR